MSQTFDDFFDEVERQVREVDQRELPAPVVATLARMRIPLTSGESYRSLNDKTVHRSQGSTTSCGQTLLSPATVTAAEAIKMQACGKCWKE